MSSETIWSSNTNPTVSPSTSSLRLQDQVDPDVAKFLAGPAPATGRRFSFTETGEFESNLFDFKLNFQASYAASTGGPHAPNVSNVQNAPHITSGNGASNLNNNQAIQLGTASISGGIASRHPPKESFLNKFASVADATRDIELSNGLGSLSLEGSQRRTSFNSDHVKPLMSSPHGSLNENLNMPVSRTSRHQSISEKIDNYNNSSPIQNSAALSMSSDLNATGSQLALDASKSAGQHTQSFWNPAAATSFTPSFPQNHFLDNSGFANGNLNNYPYNRGNMPAMPPISPPPFMMANPAQFGEAGMYGFMGYQGAPALSEAVDGNEKQSTDEVSSTDDKRSSEGPLSKTLPPKSGAIPGVGLMNRQVHPGFIFNPFNPYAMYPLTSPAGSPANVPVEGAPGVVPQPMLPVAFEAAMMQQVPPPPPPPPATAPQAGLESRPHSSAAPSGKRGKSAKNQSAGKGGNHIYRSPLLEEVRSNSKNKEYALKDIYGHAVEFTMDQHGSRFIQQKLPQASEEEKEVIFNEIREISYDLMTDVFGNYVIQKYFEHGSDVQKEVLLECMKDKTYELSLQMYGCRVVQRALEAISLKGQIQIVEELRDHVLVCAKDQNGNHVIQKSIERIPFQHIRFILDSLSDHIYHLSTHPYGCRVIQRLLEHSDIADQEKILAELNKFIFYLIQDQYGNYVIQHILERGDNGEREKILEVALGSIVNFSKHKFASNVIEKCIKHGSTEQRKRILHEVMLGNEDLTKESVDDDSPLALMMKDQYANYVIQKLVEGFDAKSQEKKNLVVKLRQYLKQISMRNNYGKHLASVEKMIIVAETALVEADRN